MEQKPLAIGIDDYKRIIDRSYYYVDKTLLIKNLLDNAAQVTLFTRPRRFGKTLALSMLKTFFECERTLSGDPVDNTGYFTGKNIQNAGEKYQSYMGQYPVIFLSFKSARQPDYSMAYQIMCEEIAEEYRRHSYILSGEKLSSAEKSKFTSIMERTAGNAAYATSIKFLSKCLRLYHEKNAIILIDEYDVPLENAYFGQFYGQMVMFIRSLFESALKSNENLEFAVITGCLRITKESIFTGLNNLKIHSVLDHEYAQFFGFTTQEVTKMLADYSLSEKETEIQQWYDGYQFGSMEIYNPWSVVNYIDTGRKYPEAFPKPYWSNTSSNQIVRHLIETSDEDTKTEIETLIQGNAIQKTVHEDITYEDIYQSQDNLWNFLFFTGYLKKIKETLVEDSVVLSLKIPNRELRYLFRNTIQIWFEEKIKTSDLSHLYQGIVSGNAELIQKELSALLLHSISYMDSYENFYHGFLLGILMNLKGYKITSNREAGNGRYDIAMESRDGMKTPIILEFKVAKRRPELMDKAKTALKQIVEMNYDAPFIEEGYSTCIHIGIAFYQKMCWVVTEEYSTDIELSRTLS
ncbi:MAG: AAA family ATPase [Agathobacter sp.]|nr:AAA family ATPase [Agathobacter sp.]